MSKRKLYIVFLKKEFDEILKNNNSPIELNNIDDSYSLPCSMVTESSYFLKVVSLHGKEVEVHIPYQYVLFVMATPDSKIKKSLGFGNTKKGSENHRQDS